jgi:hypothetical protein
MPAITFTAPPYTIGTWTVLPLPKEASLKLPSRGQVMVKGTINGFSFETALEPDGNGSHWLHIDDPMQKSAYVAVGEAATLQIESTKEWPEPHVPADLKKALEGHAAQQKLWADITPLARWEWIRWIGSTSKADTRKRRIDVAFSKLSHGERRPCCFNRSMCCVPDVSKNGVLLQPQEVK